MSAQSWMEDHADLRRASQAPVALEGNLSKRGEDMFHKWKTRKFRLQGTRMNYFEPPNQLGFIQLREYDTVSPVGEKGSHGYEFTLSDSKDETRRVFHLAAPTAEERDNWVKQISAIFSDPELNSLPPLAPEDRTQSSFDHPALTQMERDGCAVM